MIKTGLKFINYSNVAHRRKQRGIKPENYQKFPFEVNSQTCEL